MTDALLASPSSYPESSYGLSASRRRGIEPLPPYYRRPGLSLTCLTSASTACRSGNASLDRNTRLESNSPVPCKPYEMKHTLRQRPQFRCKPASDFPGIPQSDSRIIFQITSRFLFYSISGASCWHKVTPDEHRQLHGATPCFAFNHCLLEARREKKGAQSTNRMISCSSQTPIAGPLQRQDAGQDDLLSDPVGKSYVLALCSTRHCPIKTQTDLFIPRDEIQRAKTSLLTKAIEEANMQNAFSPIFGGNPVT